VALAALLFSYIVEVSQYLNLVKHVGLQKYAIANIVMGHSFEWIDMLVYTLGILMVILVERTMQPQEFRVSPKIVATPGNNYSFIS